MSNKSEFDKLSNEVIRHSRLLHANMERIENVKFSQSGDDYNDPNQRMIYIWLKDYPFNPITGFFDLKEFSPDTQDGRTRIVQRCLQQNTLAMTQIVDYVNDCLKA